MKHQPINPSARLRAVRNVELGNTGRCLDCEIRHEETRAARRQELIVELIACAILCLAAGLLALGVAIIGG